MTEHSPDAVGTHCDDLTDRIGVGSPGHEHEGRDWSSCGAERIEFVLLAQLEQMLSKFFIDWLDLVTFFSMLFLALLRFLPIL